jgi:hypothetical protein
MASLWSCGSWQSSTRFSGISVLVTLSFLTLCRRKKWLINIGKNLSHVKILKSRQQLRSKYQRKFVDYALTAEINKSTTACQNIQNIFFLVLKARHVVPDLHWIRIRNPDPRSGSKGNKMKKKKFTY